MCGPDHPDEATPLDVLEAHTARRIVADASARYLAATRERIVPFVDEHFSFSGARDLHRRAVGWDLLRAPANLGLAIPQFGLMCGSGLARRVGWRRGADWMGDRRLVMETDVARELDWLLHTELLQMPIRQGTREATRDALAEAVFADPRIETESRVVLHAVGRQADDPDFRRDLERKLAVYTGSRDAAAEITTAIVSTAVGAMAFNMSCASWTSPSCCARRGAQWADRRRLGQVHGRGLQGPKHRGVARDFPPTAPAACVAGAQRLVRLAAPPRRLPLATGRPRESSERSRLHAPYMDPDIAVRCAAEHLLFPASVRIAVEYHQMPFGGAATDHVCSGLDEPRLGGVRELAGDDFRVDRVGDARRVVAGDETEVAHVLEVVGGERALVAGAARDFWRRRMYPASRTLAGYAHANGFRPESARRAGSASGGRSRTFGSRGGSRPSVPIEDREAAWRGGARGGARGVGGAPGDVSRTRCCMEAWLHRGQVPRAPRTTVRAGLDRGSCSPPPSLGACPRPGLFARYGGEALAAACKRGHELPDEPAVRRRSTVSRTAAAEPSLGMRFNWLLRWARREILAEARDAIRRRVREDRCFGYDDLLLELWHEASRRRREPPFGTDPARVSRGPHRRVSGHRSGPGRGVHAHLRVERRCPGERAAAGRPDSGGLRVVGDPKQSIYRFRGADVFAYLRTRGTAHSIRSLERNWRSVPALVEAVNAVFAGANPFAVPEIPYPPVMPGRDRRDPLRIEEETVGAPLRIRLLPERPDDETVEQG